MSNIVVGKDIIELLGSAMYSDPLSVYREYIQNSVDAIDDAIKSSVLKDVTEARVDIKIDNVERKITITDNGAGIPKSTFKRRMIAIGASGKRNTSARGFRGIGRLAGLGFCQELIFRSRAVGQDVCELKWNIHAIRQLLADDTNKADLSELIKSTTETQYYPSDTLPDHFFEVELIKPLRVGGDILMNIDRVKSYISQVAPVPFSDNFSLAKKIRRHVNEHGELREYKIFINDEEDHITKPYQDVIHFSDHKTGDLTGNLDLITIEGLNGDIAAAGWIADSDYLGAIPPKALVGGLRARIGNLQIGERNIFVDIFPEPRFNSWAVGEVYLFNPKLIPNGRRDSFEQNSHLADLRNKLLPHCTEVAKQCRKQSSLRNVRKRIEHLLTSTKETVAIIDQGVISKLRLEQKTSIAKGNLSEITLLLPTAEYLEKEQTRYSNEVETLYAYFHDHTLGDNRKASAPNLTKAQQALFSKFCDLVYECSANQNSAKALIDRIIVRL